MNPAVSHGLDGPALGEFIALLKPRVMSLVVFTGVVGLVLAPGDIHPVIAFTALLCIAVGAGASGAINMWADRDIDAVMARTRDRPIPAGRIDARSALEFGVILAIGSTMLMALAVNWVAAALLALTIGFYVFVYTLWLKRRTPQNIVIGGAAGALPPVIGWAAVTGSVELFPLLLFAIIFVWTPPHFWALALLRSSEYAEARVPMLPVVRGAAETRRQIMLYSMVLAPLGVAPWLIGAAGGLYGGGASMLGLVFVWRAYAVWRDGEDVPIRRLFAFSIAYLFLMFTLLLVDRWSYALTGWTGA